jgi:hypothetical protein
LGEEERERERKERERERDSFSPLDHLSEDRMM